MHVLQSRGHSQPRPTGHNSKKQRALVLTRFKAPTQEPGVPTQPREVLREVASIGDDTYSRVNSLHGGSVERLEPKRLLPVLLTLVRQCHLTSRELQLILVRFPQCLATPPEDLNEVLAFLREDLQLDSNQLRSVVTRFPQVFSYNVKAHLKPQLAYLLSLGVEPDHLRDYICARPLLLGEGIETVIKFLRLCGVPRKQMAALLRSYPIDYCCRFIYKKGVTDAPKPKDP